MPFRRFNETELVLTQRLHLERPLLVQVMLSAAAFTLAEGSVIFFVLSMAAVIVNAVALHRRSEIYLPRKLINVAVLAATGVAVLDYLRRGELLPTLGHYLILIQVCKLFERKHNRDYAQVVALSLVLLVAGAMISSGLLFGLLMAASVPVACYVAMVLTLKMALDAHAGTVLATESRPPDPQRLAWNVATLFPRPALVKRAFTSALVCMAMAAFVFLLMPRGKPIQLGPLAFETDNQPSGGMPNSLRLRNLERIRLGQYVVMQVRLTRDGRNIAPEVGPPYLRGRIYQVYRGGTWFVGSSNLKWWRNGPPLVNMPAAADNIVDQQVTMDPSLLPTLFAIAPVVNVETPAGVELSGCYPDLAVECAQPEAPLRYTIRSWLPPLSVVQRKYLGKLERGPDRAPDDIGEIPPAAAELARYWCVDLLMERDQINPLQPLTPERRDELGLEMARRIAGHLRTEYAYTLDLSSASPDGDPIEDFLLRTRKGHCELFAAAMTLMCRAVGVQAHMAGGYYPDDLAGGQYIVRASDAHAWCEVYTPSADWQIFDATPPGAVQQARRGLGRLANMLDALGFSWKINVIGYGEEDRQNLFGRMLSGVQGLWDDAAKFLSKAGRSVWDFIRHGRVSDDLYHAVLAVGISLGIAGLIAAVVKYLGNLRRKRVPEARHVDPPEFYRRLVKLLRRHGLRQRPEQTAREFVAHAAGALTLPAEARSQMAGLAELLYKHRWSGTRLAGDDLVKATRTVRQLAETVSAKANVHPT